MLPFFASIAPMFQTFAVACTKTTFLGLVPWYQFLTLKEVDFGNSKQVAFCSITTFDDSSKVLGAHSAFLLVGLALLDDLIRIAAMVAIGYVIYGGIQYVTSQGAPDATRKAQQTIINALIGVTIAILAASFVAFIGSQLGGIN